MIKVVFEHETEDDSMTFSSGKKIEPNRGYVGINPNLEMSEGYDCELYAGGKSGLKANDIRELSDYMISLWQQAKDKAEDLATD